MGLIDGWLGAGPDIRPLASEKTERAILAWRRISEKPTSIVVKTSSGSLAAQTVRIESDSRATDTKTVAGGSPRRKVIIFGVYDHPTVANTNLKEGWYFNLGEDRYNIQDVIYTLGEVQAIAEAVR